MAKGKIKRIENVDRKFGASPYYLFVKVQADWSSTAEEYLLLTAEEYASCAARGSANPEDTTGLARGILTLRNNEDRRFGAAPHYYAVKVASDFHGTGADLLITDAGLERIRQRVEKNAEDIEANKEGWLADLLD